MASTAVWELHDAVPKRLGRSRGGRPRKDEAMLRILALSDVHGKLDVVRRLRAQEPDRFDVVVAAGDLGFAGGDRAAEVLSILATFGCPVLYVLGNHDGKVPYDRDFGPRCHHLHHRAYEHDGVAFVGYSGLPANWGLNPIAMELQAAAEGRHAEVAAQAAELESARLAEVARIEAETEHKLKRLHAKVGDRRRKAYQDKASDIYNWQRTRSEKAGEPGRQLRMSDAWRAKENDEGAAHDAALAPNRAALARMVRELDPRRCVVVTHERQTQANVDMPWTALFLFGHVHGYSDTTWRGSRFVNVSALDDQASGPFGAGPDAQARMGTYAVIEIRDGIACERVRLAAPPAPDPASIPRLRRGRRGLPQLERNRP